MEVQAKKRGFFGGLYRRPGDKFNCSQGEFSENWMEVVTTKTKPYEKPEYEPLEIPALMQKPDAKEDVKAKDKPKRKYNRKK